MRRAIYEDDVIKLLDKGWKSGVYPVASNIHALPSAQPELTDEDMKLIKQLRSYHNGSYAKVIDKLLAAASAQPEIIRCGNCKHWTRTCGDEQWGLGDCDVFDKHLVMCNGYCAWAERREE